MNKTKMENTKINDDKQQVENDNKSMDSPRPSSSLSTTTAIPIKKKSRSRWKKKPKDASAPKHPLTGYVRYMNDRREELRKSHPHLSAVEMTKKIGEEWMTLNDERKKPYLEAAEIDKERFNREVFEYKEKMKKEIQMNPVVTTNTDIQNTLNNTINSVANNTANDTNNTTSVNSSVPIVHHIVTNEINTNSVNNDKLQINNKENSINNCNNNNITNNNININGNNAQISNSTIRTRRPSGDYDIQIFTDEFLDHNKTVDSELRIIRKSNIDFEQQNSVLEKHVENMKNGIDKLNHDNIDLDKKNILLSSYLEKLKKKLSTALSSLSIPSELNGANIDNIEKYMSDLQQMATSNSHGPASLNKAKDILRKLDLQIQL